MSWIALAAFAALSYALYYILVKLSSGHIHQILGAFVLQGVAALTGGVLVGALKLGGRPLAAAPRGLLLAALAGLAVGAAEILTFYLFERGAPASQATAVIIGGSVALAALLGMVLLREPLTLRSGLGIGFVLAGVALLAGR